MSNETWGIYDSMDHALELVRSSPEKRDGYAVIADGTDVRYFVTDMETVYSRKERSCNVRPGYISQQFKNHKKYQLQKYVYCLLFETRIQRR